MTANLGIDIAKKKFDVALFRNGKYKHKAFENGLSGFDSLLAWLKQHDVVMFHAH